MPWVHLMGSGPGHGPQQVAEHLCCTRLGHGMGAVSLSRAVLGRSSLGVKCIMALGPEGQKLFTPSSDTAMTA